MQYLAQHGESQQASSSASGGHTVWGVVAASSWFSVQNSGPTIATHARDSVPTRSSLAAPGSHDCTIPESESESEEKSHLLWGKVEDSSSSQLSSDRDAANKNARFEGLTLLDDTPSSDTPSSVASGGTVQSGGIVSADVDLAQLALLPEEELRTLVPLRSNQMPSSIGSMSHDQGVCCPCSFFHRNKECRRGLYCRFCHLPHDPLEKKRSKPCKGQRVRYRKRLERMQSNLDQGLDPRDVLPPSIAVSKEKTDRVLSRLEKHRKDPKANEGSLGATGSTVQRPITIQGAANIGTNAEQKLSL